MDLYAGAISLGEQSVGIKENARSLANEWVDSVMAANVTEDYESDKFSFWSLTDIGEQDVILALEKNASGVNEFSSVIPEVKSSVLLMGSVAFGFVFIRRRRI
jgi:hypothetical protein